MRGQHAGWGTSEEEAECVRAAQRGDARAFERLVTRLRPRLYRWALVRSLDPDEAEDVVQSVVVRLHSALPGYRGEARLGTWLYTLVRSAALDRRRADRRREGREAGFARDRPDLVPARSFVDPVFTDAIRNALQSLTRRQREVFDLADLQGMPPIEIGELLGMSASTVRVHLLRARRTVRARMLALRSAEEWREHVAQL